jgi:hypothetical protein
MENKRAPVDKGGEMGSEERDNPGENEKRNYFRIDDVISVVANPVTIDKEKSKEFAKAVSSSKAFSLVDMPGVEKVADDDTVPDKSENNGLYGIITEVKTKLDFIINHLLLDREGFTSAEKKLVNISASGIRFTINHHVNVGDIMEIKLLLPTYPPVAVFAYGEVVRFRELDGGTFEVALEYINMGDSVKNEIIQYTLSHQRETIRKMKEYK